MDEFVECAECGFVTVAKAIDVPEPEKWGSCPDCGGTDFFFTDG